MEFHIPYNTYLARHRYKYHALYHALRDTILAGTLPHGTKLPPTRELAELYLLSRGIVSQAYEMLTAEGYLSSEVGRGTFVSYLHARHPAPPEETPPAKLSAWGERLNAFLSLPSPTHLQQPNVRINFDIGHTSTEHFPVAEWNRIFYRIVREMLDQDRRDAFAAQGHLPLRESIAQHLRRARGIDADPEDIVVVNGSVQAISLLAQLLVDPGDPVVMEDPAYRGIRHAVQAAGGVPLPAPVDERGLRPDDWDARLLFVTPSRQFPTGAVLSLERRQELLNWAMRRNAVIIEDDYDSDFRHSGRPIEPLKVLDTAERVVYVGTFSRTLFTDLRIGYAVLPKWLRDPFLKVRFLLEPHPTSILQQRALAHFMKSGQYERHLRRMKRIYGAKHELCSEELRAKLGHAFDFVDSDAGLHIFGWWRGSAESYDAFRAACLAEGIRFLDAGAYAQGPMPRAALFGFAHLTDDDIRTGIAEMARLLP